MSRTMRTLIATSAFGWSVFLVGVAGAQIPEPAQRRTGEVIGDAVYVRSGPSLNHYPVAKLKAGDRVAIVGEDGDWYMILPPPDAFSLISGDYVDSTDGKQGVVNGDNVRVRAGSSLSDHKYTVQTMLSKGAEVTILGKNPDGFLRITPPEGATLWISQQFVECVPDELIRLEDETREAIDEASAGKPQKAPSDEKPVASENPEPESVLAGLPPSAARRTLEQLDAEAREQMDKPLLERSFDDLIQRYQTIVDERAQEDTIASQYAQRRVAQLTYMVELTDSVRKVRRLAERADSTRRAQLAERAAMRQVVPSKPSGFDAKGELRRSALYASKAGPRRLRLIDPSTTPPRTIGYVELPEGLDFKSEDFIGQYVGVRASEKKLQPGGVNPVPIYVAAELVILQRDSTDEE
jgi:hypothetical protein